MVCSESLGLVMFQNLSILEQEGEM